MTKPDISREAAERLANQIAKADLYDYYGDVSDLPRLASCALLALRDELDRMTSERDEARAIADELDFLRHEGGPQSVSAMEDCLRDVVLPELRRTAEDLFRCVSVRLDPGSVSPSDWRDIAPAMEAVLAVEAFVGRPDDDYGARLNPILDAGSWRHHQ